MIQNAKNKHRINQGRQSRTDTGNTLLQICDDLGFNQIKETLLQIEGPDQTHKTVNALEKLDSNYKTMLTDQNKDEENNAEKLNSP